jgi:hypothetical protein
MTTLLCPSKDPTICTLGRLKCIPNVKSNACNKLSVIHVMNQISLISWGIHARFNMSSVKWNRCSKSSVTLAIKQVSWPWGIHATNQVTRGIHVASQVLPIQWTKCHEIMKNTCNMYQEGYMQQTKCYPCIEPSVMTHEEYMQQAKCQEEYMHEAKCYPWNKPSGINSVMWDLSHTHIVTCTCTYIFVIYKNS